MKWYTYTYNNIHLGRNFISLDADSVNIDKNSFLDRLATGKFVAFKTMLIDSVPVYQLHRLSKPDEAISRTISQIAGTEIRHETLQGEKLPVYSFTDLDGRSYNEINTKGKLLVVKCWFISCGACIAEFPELNALVNRYKHRRDILFISLASDGKQELQDFLKKKKFNYLVVPDMGKYMEDQLQVNAYPMHLLIDKEGEILKSTNSVHDLIPLLEEHANLSSL
ncbi:TlpA family protein disulfide reductase [Paradesertivirga mongoliensis]|uniref:TlpA family protein disulfide reductase n=1 Tax=Paradesertivirga mongoliensis TaxID=2100740 RepID=A0ABW4ZSU7_9SPHI|nr:TlpA disulfide reductase family protein [Pedobacter mongoliensis]